MQVDQDSRTAEEMGRRLIKQAPGLRAFCLKLDPVNGEDLAQETLERALRYGHAFDPGGSLTGWLKKTAFRRFLELRRREARIPRSLGAKAAELPAPAAGRSAEDREQLDRLLSALTEKEREALLRFHQRGESLAEIAADLEMPVGTVKSLLHRARRKCARRGEEGRRKENLEP